MENLRRRKGSNDTEGKSTEAVRPTDADEWKQDLAFVVLLGIAGLIATVMFVIAMLWPMDDANWAKLTIPTTLDRLKEIGEILTSFKDENFYRAIAAHACIYFYLQAFAIPGTVFVNLLGGALFGLELGYPLCLVYNTLGSIALYMISKYLLKRPVNRFFPKKLDQFREMVENHDGSLFLNMTFLRIFPMSPNWFINVASGQLGISLIPFSCAILIGLTPYNFLSCKAGLILSQLTSTREFMDTQTTIWLTVIAVMGLLMPVIAKKFVANPLK